MNFHGPAFLVLVLCIVWRLVLWLFGAVKSGPVLTDKCTLIVIMHQQHCPPTACLASRECRLYVTAGLVDL